MKSAKPPKEDPSVKSLRERQVRDLAELDEEENRRIKAALRPSRGIGAIRRASAGNSVAPQPTGRPNFNPGAGSPGRFTNFQTR